LLNVLKSITFLQDLLELVGFLFYLNKSFEVPIQYMLLLFLFFFFF